MHPRIRSRYLDPPRPVVLAHRGFDLEGRENTLRAFQAAVDLGAEYLETDVHATKDGVVVAFHDEDLDRATDATGPLADRTWDDLQSVRVGGSERICRLDDLLDTFPRTRFNIDVKTPSVVRPLVSTLLTAQERHGDVLERTCIASFSDARRRAALALLPGGVCSSAGTRATAMLWQASRRWALGIRRPLTNAALRDAQLVQVPIRQGRITIVDDAFITYAHRNGIQVHVWTINDEETMSQLLSAGVDGLVTDRSDIALTLAPPQPRS